MPIMFLLMALNVNAQLSKNHWLPPIHTSRPNQVQDHYVYLSTPEATPFTVAITTGDGTPIAGSPFTISQGNPTTVLIGNAQPSALFLDINDVNIVNDKGLILTAPYNFYVTFKVRSKSQAELAVSKGENALGTTFRLGSVPQENVSTVRNFTAGIMATENNTVVTISDYDTDVVFSSGTGNVLLDTQTFTLNAGESVVLAGVASVALANKAGFIGALVTSTKPVAVTTGNALGGVSNNKHDFNIDQIVPFDFVGNEYILLKGNGSALTERPLVVAHIDNTEVYINGNALPTATLNAGEYLFVDSSNYQGINNKNMYISTSQNVYMYQLLAGAIGNQTSGLNIIPPLKCIGITAIDLMPSIDSIGTNFYSTDIFIATQTGAVVTLNNTAITALPEPVLGNPDWESYRLSGYTGDVKVESTLPMITGIFGASGAAGFSGYYSSFALEDPTNSSIDVCSSETIDLFSEILGQLPAGGVWTPALASGTDIFDGSIDTAGVYTYTISDTCSIKSVDVTVTIVPNPVSPTSTGDISVCEDGMPQTLDANNAIIPVTGQTITWYNASGAVVTAPILTSTTPSTVTYFATVTDNATGCESLNNTRVILSIVSSLPPPSSTGDITVCEDGTSQTLDANNAITPTANQTITWYNASGAVVTTPKLTSITPNTLTYFAKVTDNATGCESSNNTRVILSIVSSLPPPSSTGDITVCENGTSQTLDANNAITPTANQTITWYNASGAVVTTPILTSTTPQTVAYFATVTDNATGCESLNNTRVILTINAAPIEPTSTGDITVCENGASQTLYANNAITPTANQTVTWYDASGAVVTDPILTSTTPDTVTYFATVTDNATGCESLNNTPLILTINAAPIAPMNIGDITVCEDGTSQTLDANNAVMPNAGQTINWYDNTGAVIASPILTSTTDATITYFATVTDNATGCESITNTAVILNITPTPLAPISSGDINVCEDGTSQTLDANNAITPATGQIITWYDVSGAVVTTPILTSTTPDTVTYFATVTDTITGCESFINTPVILSINAIPIVYLGEDFVLCVDPLTGIGSQTVSVENQPANNETYTYTWTPKNPNLYTNGEESAIFNITTNGTYDVRVTNNTTGCFNFDSITVTQSSAPDSATAEIVSAIFSSNNTIEVSVKGGFGIYEYSIDNGFTWQSEPVFSNLDGGSYTILVSDIERCDIIETNSVFVITYPLFFTPNGDGINDTWSINAKTLPNATTYIFNRYGKLLKQLNSSQNEKWDGTYINNILPTSDYWFLFEYEDNGSTKQFKTHFTLKR